MMGMNMNNRGTMPGPAMGPGPSLGPEGAANIGTPMMPDNGAVVMYPKILIMFLIHHGTYFGARITSHLVVQQKYIEANTFDTFKINTITKHVMVLFTHLPEVY